MSSGSTVSGRPVVAIIGGGPRGVSLLERIGANLDRDAHLTVHIVEDTQIGAGRVWRTSQNRELCMNTLAGAVTLFPDESVTMSGPVTPGPTLHEWSLLVAGRGADVPAEHRAAFDAVPVPARVADEFRDELAVQRPESHPSRALYGEYISWVYAFARHALPAGVTLIEHHGRVVRIDAEDGQQRLTLDGGETIVADSVVAATGWMPHAETTEERTIAAAVQATPGLVWVRPDSPADQDLDAVPDGEPAIVRGLGMGFFDAMALLSIGRGGRFVEDADAAGGLRYEPSGREPVLHVTSNRGVPFRSKTLYGSLPPKATLRHLRGVDWGSEQRPIDMDRRIWPLILKDAYADWADALARVSPASIDLDGAQEAIAALDVTVAGTLHDRTVAIVERVRAGITPFLHDTQPLDLLAEAFPGRDRTWDSPDAFDAWVTDFVERDLREAEKGRDSLVKAALWSISASRGFCSRLGTFGGFTAESRDSAFRTLMSVGGMVGSGPPAFRNRELLALHEAGLVRFIGPAAHLETTAEGFRATSPAVADSSVEARTLIDAWMHSHDVRASADPLVHQLEAAGRIRPFRAPSPEVGFRTTAAFDIDPQTGLVIHPDGTIDDALHVSGIPIDAAMHDSIISPMPKTDPTMLRETDRVARSLLSTARTHERIGASA